MDWYVPRARSSRWQTRGLVWVAERYGAGQGSERSDRAARVMADAMVLVETPEPLSDRASGWVAAVYFLEEIFRQSGGVP